ncbi:MAG: dihydropteroate synthase [Acutalibacteraceae bacterium]|nr:dihydropteroate synthase [Acutalibacteraceae bacterium]
MKHILLKDGTLHTFTNMEMMGIINVTPDSFYSGSRAFGTEKAMERAEKLISEGAAFLDIGGESTRPGSAPVTPEEEQERVCPVIHAIKERYPDILLSVDTYHAATAQKACEAGVDIINDISALTFDPDMVHVVAENQVPVILMHINGRPDHMQDNPHYDDVVEDVYAFLDQQIDFSLAHGISDERIIIDLGIGFGKTVQHNIDLLKNIDRFQDLGMPHLLAVSRKSFIGATLHEEDPEERLFGTVGVSAYAAMHGIEMARVHDVKANLDAVRMVEALQ